MLSTDPGQPYKTLGSHPCHPSLWPPSVAEDASHYSDNSLLVLPIPVDQIEDHFYNSFAQNLLKIDL